MKANNNERGVFVLEQFSLSQDKELQVTLYERGGGRTLSFSLDQEDLLLAQKIDAVMTVATKGVPLANAVANVLNVPLSILFSLIFLFRR